MTFLRQFRCIYDLPCAGVVIDDILTAVTSYIPSDYLEQLTDEDNQA